MTAVRTDAVTATGHSGMVRALSIAGALLVVAHMHRAGGGVIAPELHARLGLGGAQLGLIMGAMFFASALTQLPIGLAFDRFGARLTISATALAAIAGTLVFALGDAFAWLLLARFLIGLGFAGVVTALLLLTMRWAPPERFSTVGATALGLASGIGSAIATVPLARLLTGFGWAPTFLAIAGVTALITFLVFAFVRDAPASDAVTSRDETLRGAIADLGRMVRRRELRFVLVMAVSAIAPFMCVGGLWAGPYLRDVYALSTGQMSTVLLGMVVVFNLATLGYGPLDRLLASRKRVVLGGAALTATTLAALALAPGLELWQALVLLHLVALGAPFYVTLTAHCRSFVPDRQAGRAITSLNLVSLVGAFGAQWLTGLIMGGLAGDDGLGSPLGYRVVFGTVALMLLGSALVYGFAPDAPPRPRTRD